MPHARQSFKSIQSAVHAPAKVWNAICLRICNAGKKIYEWTQSLDDVELFIVPPPGVGAKDLNVEITMDRFQIGIKGNAPFLDEELAGMVSEDESIWSMGKMEYPLHACLALPPALLHFLPRICKSLIDDRRWGRDFNHVCQAKPRRDLEERVQEPWPGEWYCACAIFHCSP